MSRADDENASRSDRDREIRWEECPLATKKSTSASGKTASRAKTAAKPPAKARPAAKAAREKANATAAAAAATAVEVDDVDVDQVQEEPESDCKHAWLIEPPNGPTSDGACTICGMKREFRNSYEYTPSWTARSGKTGAAKASAAKAAANNASANKTTPSAKDSR